MAESDDNANGARSASAAVVSAGQDAADMARATAQRAAERVPDAVAGAQTAVTQTQAKLNDMDNDALLVGSSFSLGMGVALFLTGSNRLLVVAAIAPAVAMLLTMFGRGQLPGSSAARRVTTKS